MKNIQLDLNFATPCRQYSPWVFIFLGLVAMASVAWLAKQEQAVATQLSALHAQRHDDAPKPTIRKLSATQESSLVLTHQTEQALNQAWEPLFTAIESVIERNPNVAVLGLDPNRNRSEVILTGQAPDFASLMRMLNSLQAMHHDDPSIGEATLLNQHWVSNNEQRALSFTVAIGWRL